MASSDPRAVASVIELSEASYRKMVQNLAWAAGYNVVAIPLAAGALAWAGITVLVCFAFECDTATTMMRSAFTNA